MNVANRILETGNCECLWVMQPTLLKEGMVYRYREYIRGHNGSVMYQIFLNDDEWVEYSHDYFHNGTPAFKKIPEVSL